MSNITRIKNINLKNRSHNGSIYDNMRKTRAHFKCTPRFATKQEETA